MAELDRAVVEGIAAPEERLAQLAVDGEALRDLQQQLV